MNITPAFDIIVCGSLHLDIVVHTAALPRVDETAVGTAWQQICGGKGGNQAVQAARAGAKTALIGRAGKDGYGDMLLANLKSAGVDSSAIALDPTTGSGMSIAILQDNGEYGAVIVSGSNLEIDLSSISKSWGELGGAKLLVLQNEVPHAVNVAAAKVASRKGARIVFNAAPAKPLSKDLSDLVDVLVVNRVEAELISSMNVTDRLSAIKCLPSLGASERSVVITLGGGGLVLQEKAGPIIEIEALPVKVTSTHGAGDCFIGVLAAKLASGHSLELACRIANEKAAAFVSRILE